MKEEGVEGDIEFVMDNRGKANEMRLIRNNGAIFAAKKVK